MSEAANEWDRHQKAVQSAMQNVAAGEWDKAVEALSGDKSRCELCVEVLHGALNEVKQGKERCLENQERCPVFVKEVLGKLREIEQLFAPFVLEK